MTTQTEPTEPSSPLIIEGLSIEHYAGIQAALAEGFSDAEVLAQEGLEAERWAPAKAGWLAALAGDGPNGALFAAYRDKLAFAEDWLAREVTPIDADARAWASFLGAFAASADPMSVLSAAGLRMSDLARLQRRWQEKVEDDPNVGKALAEHAGKKPTAMPAIKASAAVLRPFPWSKKGATDPPLYTLPKPVLAGTSLSLDLSLIAGAALPFSVGEAPKEISIPSASPPVKRLDLGGTSLAVEVPLGPALPFLGDKPPAPAAPPPAKKLDLGGTSLALDIPDQPALPFTPGEASKAVTTPSQYHPTKKLDFSTALAVEVPLEAALPAFLRDIQSEAKPSPAPVKKLELAGTSLALDIPEQPALPFTPGEAPKEITTASQYHPTKKLDFSTALAVEVPSGLELPAFLRDKPPPAEAKPPKPDDKSAAPWAPPLTLEQHASLCVELGMSQGREAEVLARYRLTPELKQRIDQVYREKVTSSPEAKAAWDKAYRAYYAWVTTNRR